MQNLNDLDKVNTFIKKKQNRTPIGRMDLNTVNAIELKKLTNPSKLVPVSQIKLYERTKKINKPKIVEFALRNVKLNLGLETPLKKVKEIDYKSISKIIEETYSRIYLRLLLPAEKSDSPNNIDVGLFLKGYLEDRFINKNKIIDQLLSSIIYSAFLLKEKFEDCNIFYKFVTYRYHPLELTYFIFVRALVEKETRIKFYDMNSGKNKETRTYYLGIDTVNKVIEKIFGIGKESKINRFKQKVVNYDKNILNQERIHVYVFLKIALEDYNRCRAPNRKLSDDEDLIILLPNQQNRNKKSKKKKKRKLYVPDRPDFIPDQFGSRNKARLNDLFGNSAEKKKEKKRISISDKEFEIFEQERTPATFLEATKQIMEFHLEQLVDTLIDSTYEKKSVNLGKAAIDGQNMRGLLMSVILGKFQKLLEIIASHKRKAFFKEIGKSEDPEKDQDVFDSFKMTYDLMKEEFLQSTLENPQKRIREFCKTIISQDLMMSELIKIISLCALNLKFSKM